MGKYTHVSGLSPQEVENNRIKFGSNVIQPPEVESFWEKLLENFQDPLIKILSVALFITFILSLMGYANWLEAIGIGVAIFLATFVSTYSEHKNEESFKQLQEKASQIEVKVFRSGSIQKQIIGEIVAGDYVLLQAGDKIPADGILVSGEVYLNQASLTGENVSVRKFPREINLTQFPLEVLAEEMSRDFLHPNDCFRGSVVDEGEGILMIVAVGDKTVYGELASELGNTESRLGPLQVKLSHLAEGISRIGYMGAIFIAMSFLFKQFVIDNEYSLTQMIDYVGDWRMVIQDIVNSLILGIIVIVVAVPEGLPMMIAIVLSLNMTRLLRSHVLVRKLLGIETSGSLNILFADKTGTLTKGTFSPQQYVSADSSIYPSLSSLSTPLYRILAFCICESTSSLVGSDGGFYGGNNSDRAILSFINPSLSSSFNYTRIEGLRMIKEKSFNSADKFSATQYEIESDSNLFEVFPEFLHNGWISSPNSENISQSDKKNHQITLIKGAPELLLNYADSYFNSDNIPTSFSISHRDSFNSILSSQSKKGTRFISLALSPYPLSHDHTTNSVSLPPKITILGAIALEDEIRPESRTSIIRAHSAGIQVVMVTGDRKETAVSIAQSIGLLPTSQSHHEEEEGVNFSSQVIDSTDMSKLNDSRLGDIMKDLRVVARALPTDKSRLVRVAQSLGFVVGMTGDGVNDSAALRKADVGFGMGSGSEIAKEASDIVILDDNVWSIMQSILYGRTIFKTIRKFIVFQSTINFASLLVVFLGPFLGFDFPLTLIQLLWVNLVMDTLAALAFGGEPAIERYMKEKPIPRSTPMISLQMWSSIIVNGSFIFLLSTMFLTWDPIYELFDRSSQVEEALRTGELVSQQEYDQNDYDSVNNATDEAFLTGFFSFFIFISTINAFNIRTTRMNLFEHLFENKGFVVVLSIIFVLQFLFTYFGKQVLRTVPLTFGEWKFILFLSFSIIPFDLLRKFIISKFLQKSLSSE